MGSVPSSSASTSPQLQKETLSGTFSIIPASEEMKEERNLKDTETAIQERLTGAELVNPYDSNRQKSEQVEEMFDSIAPAYDFMNTAMTFGLHRMWRNAALKASMARLVPVSSGQTRKILDIATGTGDVAFQLHRHFPEAEITGVDLSEGMLKVAQSKLEKMNDCAREKLRFEKGDSLALGYDDETFDMITVAYGVRNFEHLRRGYAEMWRVLRKGGVLCVIELSEPQSPILHWFYSVYSRKIIPAVGRMVSGDSRAYTYLPESISAAPQREAMCMLMREAGFDRSEWKSLTFGAVTYYVSIK